MKKSNLWKTISVFALCLLLSLIPAVGNYITEGIQAYCESDIVDDLPTTNH